MIQTMRPVALRFLFCLGLGGVGSFACGTKSTAVSGPDASVGLSDAASPVDGAGPDDAGSANDAPIESGAESCPVVTTAGGPIQPAPNGATCTYEGIPYAAPPTGDLRWKAPQAPAPWTTPRPSQAAAACPQQSSQFGTASSNEDCLYLNVWSPSPLASVAAPVMVFVHGGSFLYGSGTFGLYDGAKLAAATGHVVVTLNYRLGALGFLSNAALRLEDPANPSAGEYGIEDQIAAFQWVHENIAAFGGDAANVTIFGESAGGTSMFLHLVSPKSAGLFKQVIVESGAAALGSPAVLTAAGDAEGATFASLLACASDDAGASDGSTQDGAALMACLRGKAIADILATGGTESSPAWWPVVDGFVVPDDPVTLFAAGKINKVPTLLGNNKNEGTLFVLQSPPTDDASYAAFGDGLVPGQGAAIVAQYPIASFGGSYQAAAAEAMTDGTFLCPTRRVARAIAATGAPVFRYDFVHVMENPPIPNLGAFHGSELVFVLGNEIAGLFGLAADEQPLSELMMAYWGSMAASGNPNGGTRFAWPAYDATAETEIVLDSMPSTETQLKKAACDFWDGIEQ